MPIDSGIASTHDLRSTVNLGLTRRDLLRGLALGGASIATGAGLAAAQSTPESGGFSAPAAGIRQPGGPSVSQKTFDLEGDIDRIFRFVRDDVRYEGYAGALRGPLGALWGLAGNSVDQAQLLAALLKVARVRTRFVFGALEDATATVLFEGMNLDLEAATTHAAKVHALANPSGQGAQPAELTAERQLVSDLAARGETLLAEARAQLTDGVQTILAALADADLTLPEINASLPVREKSQHVWVQYASGTGWVDLDPSFTDAKPGDVYANAELTVDVLPADIFHTLTFRITAEKVTGNQATRGELLSYSARSQDLVDLPLTLLHVKPEAIKGLGAAIEGTIEGTIQYLPLLAIGASDVVMPSDRISLGTDGGILSAFGGGDAPEGDTIAEWFEVTITSPDQPDRSVTRVVFDRLEADARSKESTDLSRVAPPELKDFGDGGGSTFVPFVSLWSIITAVGDVPLSYFDQDYSIDDLYGNLSLVPYGYHLARDASSRLLAESGSPRVFANRPNLTALVLAGRDIAADNVVVEPAIDLLFQSVVPLGWNSGPAAGGRAHVAAGVLNHVTERMVLAGPGDGAGSGISLDISVGRVFEEAERQGVTRVALLPGAPIPDSITLSSRARQLIETALESGYFVLAPARPVELNGDLLTGWWQVHMQTAETLDMMENGRSTTVPYARTLLIGTRSVPAIRAMSCGAALMFIYAGSILAISGSLGAFGFALGGDLLGAAIMGASAAQGVGAGAAGTGAAIAIGC